MKTPVQTLAAALLALTMLTAGVFAAPAAEAQSPSRYDGLHTTDPKTRPRPDAALARHVARIGFNCMADYNQRQLESIILALPPEQLVALSSICTEQGAILQDYIDNQMIDGHQGGLFRYNIRAALASGRAIYFKHTRANSIRTREEMRRQSEARIAAARERSAQMQTQDTAGRAQRAEAAYQDIRRRRSAN